MSRASEQAGLAEGRLCFVLQGAKEKSDLAPGSVKEQNMNIREMQRTGCSSDNVLGNGRAQGVQPTLSPKRDCCE